MFASFIKKSIVIVLLPLALVIALVMMFYSSDQTREKQLPSVALVLPGRISDPGFNRTIFTDVNNAFEKPNIANLVTIQNVSPYGLKQAIASVRERKVKTIILGYPSTSKVIEELIYTNPDLRFVGLFKTIGYYGNYSSYVPRWIHAAYMAGFTAASAAMKARIGLVAMRNSAQTQTIINAFVQGAKKANSGCMVFVSGLSSEDTETVARGAADRLIDLWEVDSLSYLSVNNTVSKRAIERGVPYIGFMESATERDPNLMIAHIRISTDRLFRDIARDFEFNHFSAGVVSEYDASSKTISLESFSNNIPMKKMRDIKKVEDFLIEGGAVFRGPIWDNNGIQRALDNEVLSDQAFFNSSWFADGTYVVP